jgi:hypothetical protein
LFSGVYYDYSREEYLSAVTGLLTFRYNEMLENIDFYSFNIFIRGGLGWVSMFIPIISGFAYVTIICDERINDAARYSMFRTSLRSYHTAKFLTGFLSGAIVAVIGYALFGLLAYILFPGFNEYAPHLVTQQHETYAAVLPVSMQYIYHRVGIGGLAGVKLFEMSLYGAVWSIPAVLLTGFAKNKFLILCIPFLGKYILALLLSSIQQDFGHEATNLSDYINRATRVLYPDALRDVFWRGNDSLAILLYVFALLLTAYFLYYLKAKRKFDYGE